MVCPASGTKNKKNKSENILLCEFRSNWCELHQGPRCHLVLPWNWQVISKNVSQKKLGKSSQHWTSSIRHQMPEISTKLET